MKAIIISAAVAAVVGLSYISGEEVSFQGDRCPVVEWRKDETPLRAVCFKEGDVKPSYEIGHNWSMSSLGVWSVIEKGE